jgi:hypothetical protein
MVSVLASRVVDREFEPRSGQTKDYKIGICCFSAKHAALRRKSKVWLALNQDNGGLLASLSVEVIDNAAILFNNFAMHTFSDQINENMLRFTLY